jgi:hypothetical protein
MSSVSAAQAPLFSSNDTQAGNPCVCTRRLDPSWLVFLNCIVPCTPSAGTPYRMILKALPNFCRLSSQSSKGIGSCPASASREHDHLKSFKLCGKCPSLLVYTCASMMPLSSQSLEVSRKSMNAMSVKLLHTLKTSGQIKSMMDLTENTRLAHTLTTLAALVGTPAGPPGEQMAWTPGKCTAECMCHHTLAQCLHCRLYACQTVLGCESTCPQGPKN